MRDGSTHRKTVLVMMVLLAGLVIFHEAAMSEAPAQFGMDLLSSCRDDAVLSRFWCLGYVTGMGTAIDYFRGGSRGCWLPPEATAEQGRMVLVKYLEAHPDRLHEAGSVLALEAIVEAFPCEPRPATFDDLFLTPEQLRAKRSSVEH